MYLDSRLDLSSRCDWSPVESASHQRLAVRPRELFSSGASLMLILRIGDSEGMKLEFDCQFALFEGPPLGETGMPAEAGAECDCCCAVSRPKTEFIELRCDLVSDIGGANSLVCDVLESRLVRMGRNKSRVKSKISEPMAPIAELYLSRRILDSLTKNSANILTRSASEAAVASCRAKAWKRSIVAVQNWSAV